MANLYNSHDNPSAKFQREVEKKLWRIITSKGGFPPLNFLLFPRITLSFPRIILFFPFFLRRPLNILEIFLQVTAEQGQGTYVEASGDGGDVDDELAHSC